MKRLLFIAVLLIMLLQFLTCQNILGMPGDNAAAFMKIGSGARAIGLGSAFVAAADDVSASFWNPAGLARLEGPALAVVDRTPVMDTDYACAAIAAPVWKIGFIGISGIYYGCGEVPMYDENGLSNGTLSDREAAVILSYAYKINQLSIGANVKYIYQDMSADISMVSDGIGGDVAVLYRMFDNLSVGAVLHNKYKIADKDNGDISSESPINIRAGIHYRLNMGKDNSLNFMLDFNQTKSYPLKLHFGTELILVDFFYLRTGLDDIYAETRGANIAHLDLIRQNLKPAFGLGLKWKMGSNNQRALIFDYAISIEKLGLRNFFTLGYQF